VANAKITALTSVTTLASADVFPVVDDPAGSPVTKKVTFGNLVASLSQIGQIPFPATQSASADVNTLDDYEEGTATLSITFATPGNLSVTYSAQTMNYTKIGNAVTFVARIATSAFTHTTASGNFQFTGLPFTAHATATGRIAALMAGYTKANYTQVMAFTTGSTTTGGMVACGSGQAMANLATGDIPTGGSLDIRFGGVYYVA
jgi:hypothetical protein